MKKMMADKVLVLYFQIPIFSMSLEHQQVLNFRKCFSGAITLCIWKNGICYNYIVSSNWNFNFESGKCFLLYAVSSFLLPLILLEYPLFKHLFSAKQMMVVDVWAGETRMQDMDNVSLLPTFLKELIIEGIAQNTNGSVVFETVIVSWITLSTLLYSCSMIILIWILLSLSLTNYRESLNQRFLDHQRNKPFLALGIRFCFFLILYYHLL